MKMITVYTQGLTCDGLATLLTSIVLSERSNRSLSGHDGLTGRRNCDRIFSNCGNLFILWKMKSLGRPVRILTVLAQIGDWASLAHMAQVIGIPPVVLIGRWPPSNYTALLCKIPVIGNLR
jgi:hypothetical protein